MAKLYDYRSDGAVKPLNPKREDVCADYNDDRDPPYPFCFHAAKCISAGRCTRDPNCCE